MTTTQFGSAIDAMLDRLARTANEDASGYPHFANATTGEWTRTPDGDWTGSYFTGQLWLAAAATTEPHWHELARTWAVRTKPRVNSDTIFRGFLFWYGAALGAQLTDDTTAREIAHDGARALAASYHPTGRLLPLGAAAEEAHSVGPEETNIDGVPGGAPLLFWVADQSSDERLATIASSHVQRHVEFCVRPDASVVQSATFDRETGELVRTYTHKGLRNDSTWARAQAWAMLGLAQATAFDPAFADDMIRVCDWWVANLPDGSVSFWDFDAPTIEPDPLPDTSATAIAAASLLKAAALDPRGSQYPECARRMVEALVERHLTPIGTGDTRPPGMLVDACYNRRIGLATSSELIWGDYFLLEALLGLSGRIDTTRL